jgi:hypothetical protein
MKIRGIECKSGATRVWDISKLSFPANRVLYEYYVSFQVEKNSKVEKKNFLRFFFVEILGYG